MLIIAITTHIVITNNKFALTLTDKLNNPPITYTCYNSITNNINYLIIYNHNYINKNKPINNYLLIISNYKH